MLSILIPTFNYDTTSLVEKINELCIAQNIDFEIIISDDCSSDLEIIKKNNTINTINNCCYIINKSNLGRGLNINSMAKKAKFDWLLLLDCDVLPATVDFLKNYVSLINNNSFQVHFGGIIYQKNKPKNSEMLRWIYGKKRESIKSEIRKSNPFESCLTSNLLIKRKVFLDNLFDERIKNYGFEDLVFALNLRDNNLKINHISNEVYHLNLEKSIVFLKKSEISLMNLKFLIQNNVINYKDSRFGILYSKLNKLNLLRLVIFGFRILKPLFIKNLISKKPSLFVFDLYRFGFYCSMK